MKKIKSPHLDVRPSWLNKLKEQPLLPDLSIIDPHHHLWDVGFGKYYVEELLEDIESSGHNIKATVYIMSSSNTKIYLKKLGCNISKIKFHKLKTDRLWLRDSGPIFLKRNIRKAINILTFALV